MGCSYSKDSGVLKGGGKSAESSKDVVALALSQYCEGCTFEVVYNTASGPTEDVITPMYSVRCGVNAVCSGEEISKWEVTYCVTRCSQMLSFLHSVRIKRTPATGGQCTEFALTGAIAASGRLYEQAQSMKTSNEQVFGDTRAFRSYNSGATPSGVHVGTVVSEPKALHGRGQQLHGSSISTL